MLLEILSAFATTISVFLHTLKFKKYIGPRTSFIVYFASYMSTFLGFVFAYDIFYKNIDLVLVTAVGVWLNFGIKRNQDVWQLVVAVLLYSSRAGVGFDLSSDRVGGYLSALGDKVF